MYTTARVPKEIHSGFGVDEFRGSGLGVVWGVEFFGEVGNYTIYIGVYLG